MGRRGDGRALFEDLGIGGVVGVGIGECESGGDMARYGVLHCRGPGWRSDTCALRECRENLGHMTPLRVSSARRRVTDVFTPSLTTDSHCTLS